MTAYLLSTQSILDRISGNPKYAIYEWLQKQETSTTDVYVSVVSIGYARASIGDLSDAMARTKYSRALDRIVGNLKREALLPFDSKMADAWATVLGISNPLQRYVTGRAGSRLVDLADVETMIIAIALSMRLTLVEPGQPYHAEMVRHGLKVETLGE